MHPILPGPGDLLSRKPFIPLTPAQARNLFGSPSLIRARDGYLQTARNCREALTDPNGPWGFGRDDERVKEAVGMWVARARKAHRLARGLKASEAA